MKKDTSYIYLNSKHYDGTVFVTQIADWLKLYDVNGINMHYCHQFYGAEIFHRRWCKEHLCKIKTVIPVIFNVSVSLPEKYFFPVINALLLNRMLNKKFPGSDRIVIFSRMLYGIEIAYLKKISKKEIFYIYDARGASCEEHKYHLTRDNGSTPVLERLFKHIKDVESATVQNADRIFCVSNVLKAYLCSTYGVHKDKFFIYPCLSDSDKFYYNKALRKTIRNELRYNDANHVYLYSGGLKNKYHLVNQTLAFFNDIAARDEDARFIFLSKDELSDDFLLHEYPHLLNKIHITSVPNEEVYKYLNAADYGTLFRDNVIMNNVASPSKFAEYVLCGLPTIISEGIGDYADLCVNKNLGIKVSNFSLENEDLKKLLTNSFDREAIAAYGKNHLSKQSQLKKILKEFERYK